MTFEQIKSAAMKLTPEERADLADLLWVSVATREEVKAAWDAEIEKRVAAMEAGKVEFVPAEQVMAELRVKLRGLKSKARTSRSRR